MKYHYKIILESDENLTDQEIESKMNEILYSVNGMSYKMRAQFVIKAACNMEGMNDDPNLEGEKKEEDCPYC